MLSIYEKRTARNEEIERELMARDEVVAKVKKELEKAQGRMKKYYDQGRRDVSFEPGDFMYLKLQPYRQKSLKKKFNVKLSQWYYGPFKVLERIGEVAYKLELPFTSRLHLVFHVTVLKKRVGNPSLISSDLPTFDTEGVLTEEATWEDYDEMVERFPDISLEDKGILEERGNVETVRKSKRIVEWRSGIAVRNGGPDRKLMIAVLVMRGTIWDTSSNQPPNSSNSATNSASNSATHPTQPTNTAEIQDRRQVQRRRRRDAGRAATTVTGRRTCSNDGDVDAGRARTTATGFQPSSSAHHHHSLQLLDGSSRRRRRRRCCSDDGDGKSHREAGGCGGGERRRTAETLSPSSLHVRRRRRRRCCTSGVPLPSSLHVRCPVSVVAAPAADLGSQLSWLAELDELLSWWLSWMSWVAELDDVSNFNWLRCNTQHMLSVAPGEEGFNTVIRPVIAVDATHLKSKTKGVLLVAVCKDGNEMIYPLAFGFANSECSKSWTWFLKQLHDVILHPELVLIVSDRHTGISNGMRAIFPNSAHVLCAYHLANNLKQHCRKRGDVIYHYYRAAYRIVLRNSTV
ncbi:hypothetical protein LWI29_011581 [Acer saccharum]|uniref:MULE transposase domain-containing protein n=1 Tax=Acer saccharum TaxID=4024 RepID=A0AA39SRZ4_ACESA|nr:hypothetical protein LWI29_011581 [Acer saccharum]